MDLGVSQRTVELHHARAMQLHRSLADAKIHRNDLVCVAANDTLHDVRLARSQQRQAITHCCFLLVRGAPLLVELQRLVNAIDQILIAKRLLHEIACTGLHCIHRHRHITVTRDEDDGNRGAMLVQTLLELEATHARHPDICHETRMSAAIVVVQEFHGGRISGAIESDGLEQNTERIAHCIVVVDQIDQRAVTLNRCLVCCLVHAAGSISWIDGNETTKVAPPPGLFL